MVNYWIYVEKSINCPHINNNQVSNNQAEIIPIYNSNEKYEISNSNPKKKYISKKLKLGACKRSLV